jgi:hypothetical protein
MSLDFLSFHFLNTTSRAVANVNGPHQVHWKDLDHQLRLASSLVVCFYAPYPYKQRRRGVASLYYLFTTLYVLLPLVKQKSLGCSDMSTL